VAEHRPVVQHNYVRFNNAAKGRRERNDPGSKVGKQYVKARRRAVRSLTYYQDRRRGADEPERQIFTKDATVSRREAIGMMDGCQGRDFLVHRVVLSPGEGRDVEDLREMTRRVMRCLEEDKRQEIDWVAVEHHNTEHPHVHLMIFGGGRRLDERGEPYGERKVVRIELGDCRRIEDEAERWADSRSREREMWMQAIDRANGHREPDRGRDRDAAPGDDGRDDYFDF
jgi:hypothetical protein